MGGPIFCLFSDLYLSAQTLLEQLRMINYLKNMCFFTHFLKRGTSKSTEGWTFLFTCELIDRLETHIIDTKTLVKGILILICDLL